MCSSDLEVLRTIKQMPADKAPGPDGFTGIFFKATWDIIKVDVMRVIHLFGNLHSDNFHWLNSANVVLIPKKEGAECISDFRPISLIHAIAKIVAKVLATRLAPLMNTLISPAQSAFIKNRSIHDNFMFVRNFARRLHRNMTPALLFKLDIRKAFDAVRWDYLIDRLRRLGFPSRFCDWISAILRTSTSRILLNGVPTAPIRHGRGLRQGDPLSPLLFDIAIDPLQQVLELATARGDLSRLRGRGAFFRISLYADDAAIFMAPIKEEITNLAHILTSFGDVTGLCTNMQKTSVVPIRCGAVDLDDVLQAFPASRTGFPMRYLGLPLSVWQLKRVDLQHLEDKIAGKVPMWAGKYINSAGRRELVRSVMASQGIFHQTSLKLPPGFINKVKKIERSFLWAASDKVSGGKCKVNWKKVYRPTELGGLGILDTERFGAALRLRWLWLEWTDTSKLWIGMGNPCTSEDYDLFYACTAITIGNGHKAPFWDSPWLDGRRPRDVAPLIYLISKRKKWCVQKAMQDDAWINQINTSDGVTLAHIQQFVALWTSLQQVHLDEDVPDTITWTMSSTRSYTASSAYHAQFIGTTSSNMKKIVWKVWAPPKCKFFAWLIIQNRVWTADRLRRRGLPNCDLCPLCKQTGETAAHLLFQCRFAKRIWCMVKDWLHLSWLDVSSWDNFNCVQDWWTHMTVNDSARRKAIASLTMLISWELWTERNARVFRHKSTLPSVILGRIKDEAQTWVKAGAKHLEFILPGD